MTMKSCYEQLSKELEPMCQTNRFPHNTQQFPIIVDYNTFPFAKTNNDMRPLYDGFIEEMREYMDKLTKHTIISMENCNMHRVGTISAIAAVDLENLSEELRKEMCKIFEMDGAKIDHNDFDRIRKELAYHWSLRNSQFDNVDYEFNINENIQFARATYNKRPCIITANLVENKLIKYYHVIDYNIASHADQHFEDLKRIYL